MKDIAVIIVNYNTKDLLRNCLVSLFLQTQEVDFEVWVVDNASTDGSIEMLKHEFTQIHLIENKVNKGFGAANNLALEQAEAKYVFLLNSDTILQNNSLKIFFDFMENHIKVAICGGHLYDANNNLSYSCGFFTTLFDDIFLFCDLKLLFKSFYLKKYKGKINNLPTQLEKEFIAGADMFIRKSCLDQSGYFDEDFFLYFEEAELTHRIKKNGGLVFILPDAKITHLDGGSWTENLKRIQFYEKSRKIYYKKVHSNFNYFIFSIFFRFYLVLRFLLKQNRYYLDYLKILNQC